MYEHIVTPMSTRMRKRYAFVFLLAISLVFSVANPSPAAAQNPANPAVPNESDLNDSYDVFYDQLSADGHWIYAENYGYVYQPNIAENNADWRPYTNGHWEATDRGWYWDTDEPFGWATYHYGRWANIDGTGWVWTPGTDWSPAWVSWRISDKGFVGWAPLPPECPRPSEVVAIGSWCDSYADTGPGVFCFLPFSAWFNSSYVGLLAPATQNLELINESRNVTNISATKTSISDFGPRPDLIAQQSGREVKTYVLHYSEARGQHNFSRSINGNLLNINGPTAKLKANATKVPTVIKTLVRPSVNKGWNGLTKDNIDGVHRKYASEAHIPSHLPNKPIERVNLVPSATPEAIRPVVHDLKEKQPKENKATAKTKPKPTEEKGGKGKTGNASAHKASAKHKTASESKEEGSSKGEGKSKGSSKTAKRSEDTDEESETPRKKASSSEDGGSKSDVGSKSSHTSKSLHASKDEGASESKDEEGGSKGEGKSKGSSKTAKRSKDTDDESETPKKKASSSEDGGSKSGGETKSSHSSKGAHGSKVEDSKGEGSKKTSKKSSEE